MKWMVRIMHVLSLAMAIWLLAKYMEGVLYSVPIVLSIAIWYWGWEKTTDSVKLLAELSVLAFALGSFRHILGRPVNLQAWFDFFILAGFPLALLMAAYKTRGEPLEKADPITWIVGG